MMQEKQVLVIIKREDCRVYSYQFFLFFSLHIFSDATLKHFCYRKKSGKIQFRPDFENPDPVHPKVHLNSKCFHYLTQHSRMVFYFANSPTQLTRNSPNEENNFLVPPVVMIDLRLRRSAIWPHKIIIMKKIRNGNADRSPFCKKRKETEIINALSY